MRCAVFCRGCAVKKLYWIWIVVGLVFFAGVYAFVFPQSQMPVRISLTSITEKIPVKAGEIYIDNEKIVTSSGKTIQLPKTDQQLPEGLNWDNPQLTGFEEKDGKVFASFSGNNFVLSDSKWTKTDYLPSAAGITNSVGFAGYSFVGLSKGMIQISKTETLEFPVKDYDEKFELTLPISADHFVGRKLGNFDFFPTSPEVGRIIKVENGQIVAQLDRSRLDPQAVPTKVATDGKKIFAMIGGFGSLHKSFPRIQVYDTNLKFISQFANSRGDHEPVSIECLDPLVLLLWDDGLLEGYSGSGYLMFSQNVCKAGVDLMAADGELFILDATSIIVADISIVKPETPVWPRIVNYGPVTEEATTTITIKSKTEPTVMVKGINVSVIGKSKLEDMWSIQLLMKTEGLPAFETYSTEAIVEIGNFHEIVPVSFIPFGTVRKIKLFSEFAIDMETGKKLEMSDFSSMVGRLYADPIVGQAILLTPAPGKPIGK